MSKIIFKNKKILIFYISKQKYIKKTTMVTFLNTPVISYIQQKAPSLIDFDPLLIFFFFKKQWMCFKSNMNSLITIKNFINKEKNPSLLSLNLGA
jgi:hypothetical protein